MRTLLVIAAASVLMTQYGRAQTAAPPSGLECIEHLETPEYPSAALQSHVDGSVWTFTQVTAQGAEKIDTQVVSAWGQGPKLLIAPAEKALKASKFKPECTGKKVTIVFRYQLNGEAAPNPKPSMRTEVPNIVWIESQPAATAGSR